MGNNKLLVIETGSIELVKVQTHQCLNSNQFENFFLKKPFQ